VPGREREDDERDPESDGERTQHQAEVVHETFRSQTRPGIGGPESRG
jgi:hypothetical protein